MADILNARFLRLKDVSEGRDALKLGLREGVDRQTEGIRRVCRTSHPCAQQAQNKPATKQDWQQWQKKPDGLDKSPRWAACGLQAVVWGPLL